MIKTNDISFFLQTCEHVDGEIDIELREHRLGRMQNLCTILVNCLSNITITDLGKLTVFVPAQTQSSTMPRMKHRSESPEHYTYKNVLRSSSILMTQILYKGSSK